MQDNQSFDFWYAVNNTEVVIRPRQQLETFGSTTIHYHLVSESMDTVNEIRIREGRIHAYRPRIITPDTISQTLLEGFGEEQARQYMQWLQENEAHLLLLKYGFSVRKELISEHLVHDHIDLVMERAKEDVMKSTQPMHALIRGVDEPWEVCLLRLMVDVIQQSAPAHARELSRDPDGSRNRIESLFRAASRDRALLPELSRNLERAGLFEEYQDRFFALARKGS